MKLYFVPISGNAYKVRILLSLLNVPHEKVVLDRSSNALTQPAFLKLSPRGEVPVLEDDGTVIWDSAACLVYVARKHGGARWLPTAPEARVPPDPFPGIVAWLARRKAFPGWPAR